MSVVVFLGENFMAAPSRREAFGLLAAGASSGVLLSAEGALAKNLIQIENEKEGTPA